MATTADSTLVQAAFKEGQTGAMADVPNLKPLYEHTTKIGKEFTSAITGIVDQINLERDQEQAETEKRMEPLKDLANEIYDATYNGGEAMPDIYVDKITERIEGLQAAFEKVNTEGKGDTKANEKERRRITGELSRVKNEVVRFRSDYMLATQDPESWNLNSVNKDNIDPLRTVLDWKSINENPNVTAEWVDGRLTTVTKGYSAGTRRVKGPEDSVLGFVTEEYKFGDSRSFNSSDILKALRKKNPANDAMVNKDQEPWATLGTTDGKNSAPRHFGTKEEPNQHAIDAETANFESLVKTDEDYYDIASRRMEGINAPSFEQAIGGNADIPISILANMFIDDNGNPMTGLAEQVAALDINNDNVINQLDEPKDSEALAKFKENMKLTRETILENKNIGLPIMADYYTKLKVTAYNENYDQQNKDEELSWSQKSARQRYWNLLNESNPGGPGGGGGGGKIDLGVSRLTNQRIYAEKKDVTAKQFQIKNAKSGDVIEGWDGKKTYQYVYNVPESGEAFWLYQIWDSDRQQFVTKGGSAEAAGGGEGVKRLNTDQVIGELIPQTMINSKKTKTW